jgi:hypothetical protein
MSGLTKRAYMVTLNKEMVTLIFSSGAYCEMIMDDMRSEHFEDIFGMPFSPATKELEDQYEKEYIWDYVEVKYLSTSDAELKCRKIMKEKGLLS